MAGNDVLISQYPKQQCVRDRNLNSLLEWANYIATQPIPPAKPDEAWVRNRLVAERIPTQALGYVDQTIAYFQQDGTVQTNIRQYLNQWNDDATETALSGQNATIIGAFMPRFSATQVTPEQVQDWYNSHGFGTPPV